MILGVTLNKNFKQILLHYQISKTKNKRVNCAVGDRSLYFQTHWHYKPTNITYME